MVLLRETGKTIRYFIITAVLPSISPLSKLFFDKTFRDLTNTRTTNLTNKEVKVVDPVDVRRQSLRIF